MKRVLFFGAATVGLLSSCFGTVGVSGGGVYGEYDGYPSAAYIATATPVYYEGTPCYWYGDRWYRRNGSAWVGLGEEPVYLRDYRVHGAVPVVRQSYGRGQYYSQPAVVHGAVRVGGGVHAAVPVPRRR